MAAKKQLNVRLPEESHRQLEEMRDRLRMSQVQVLALALGRLHDSVTRRDIDVVKLVSEDETSSLLHGLSREQPA